MMVDRAKQLMMITGITIDDDKNIAMIHKVMLNNQEVLSTMDIFNNFCFVPQVFQNQCYLSARR